MSNRKSNRGTVSRLQQTVEIFLCNKHLSSARHLSEPPGKIQYFGHLMWTADSGKVPDAGKDWGQNEKRTSEDEMAGWHHWCNGHELGQSSGNGEEQGGLACCSPCGFKESDMTGQLNNKYTFLGAELLQWINPNLCSRWLTFFFLNLIKNFFLTWNGTHAVLVGFPGGSVVKNPPAKQETQVQPLGQEDPLEEEMATHSHILAWRIPWTDGL